MPGTGETRALIELEREKREKALRDVAEKIDKTVSEIDRKVEGLVSEKVCEARTGKIEDAITAQGVLFNQAMAAQAKAMDNFAGEFRSWRESLADIIKGKIGTALAEAGRSGAAQAEAPLLARMGSNAKYLMAIISLLVVSVGGCVTGAYYLTASISVMRTALAKQEKAVTRVANTIRDEDRSPVIHYYPAAMSPDSGVSSTPVRRARHPRRRVRAAGPRGTKVP